jgi:hypothetical protein
VCSWLSQGRCWSPPDTQSQDVNPGLCLQLPPWLFPAQLGEQLLHTDDVLLIILQRPKKFSRLEHIKCLLKKDFMRLVTSKNNLNFNLWGKIFLKTIKCCLCNHMDSISDCFSVPESSCQILLHMWAHLSNMHLERLFSLSF